MAGVELGELPLQPAGVAQPQHGTAADGAAIGLDGAPRQRYQLHREAFAAGAERIDGMLHRLRLVGFEPGAERQRLLRYRPGDHQRAIADDVGLVAGGGPGHQDLWLRHQQCMEAVALGRERHDLVARGLVGGRGTQPCAHQHDRGDHGKRQHAHGECDGGKIVAAEFGERIEIAVKVLQAGKFGVRAEGHGAKQRRGGREGPEEPPSSRLSTMCPARGLDDFRHSRCAPAQLAPALTAANHEDCMDKGIAPKESRP